MSLANGWKLSTVLSSLFSISIYLTVMDSSLPQANQNFIMDSWNKKGLSPTSYGLKQATQLMAKDTYSILIAEGHAVTILSQILVDGVLSRGWTDWIVGNACDTGEGTKERKVADIAIISLRTEVAMHCPWFDSRLWSDSREDWIVEVVEECTETWSKLSVLIFIFKVLTLFYQNASA
jgi:hypothetical protein